MDKFTNRVGNTAKTLFAVLYDIPKVETNKGNSILNNKPYINWETKNTLGTSTKKCAMTEWNIEEFFEKVKEFQEGSEIKQKSICCEGLRPTLRPYQEAAVQWMIKREQLNDEEGTL